MQQFKSRSHVGADGILHLKIHTGFQNTDVEVTLTIKPVTSKTPEELGWSPGFFERTVGSWEGEPLVRPPQGEFEERDWPAGFFKDDSVDPPPRRGNKDKKAEPETGNRHDDQGQC